MIRPAEPRDVEAIHQFIVDLFEQLDALPASQERAAAGSLVRNAVEASKSAQATLEALEPQIGAMLAVISDARANLSVATVESDFSSLAADYTAVQVLQPKLDHLKQQAAAAGASLEDARRAASSGWQRAQKLVKELRETAPMATRYAIVESTDEIASLIGWPGTK